MLTLAKDLIKHRGEFLRALRTLKFERTDNGGIYFPAARAIAHGMFVHDVNGMDVRFDPNLLPTEGLNTLLDSLAANTQPIAYYLALYGGAVTPAAGWTAANFASNATEIVSGTEGFSESTRVAWTSASASNGSKHNLASKAAFTIVTASNLTVNGCGMLSASAKGATTGKLMSASRFASARVLSNTDVFNLGYTVSLTSS
jgi:hypothetical protein